MGTGTSTLELAHHSHGYHILRVQHNSPAEKAGLQPFFDFIIAIDGKPVGDNSNAALLQQQQTVQLQVYSSKTRACRTVRAQATPEWGGQGALGVSARLCSLAGAERPVWRVLSVQSGSPAAAAGLQALVDFIIGADTQLQSYDDLCDLIDSHNHRPLRLYVYNSCTDGCRSVAVTPNANWGGDGCLGCGIGYGYLHRIPAQLCGNAAQQPQHPLNIDIPAAPASEPTDSA